MPPSRQTNPWTFEQRLCLDVLWSPPFTDLSNKDRTKAHNAIFNDDFAAHGASHGRTTTAISAQYVERTYTHKSSWKTTWKRVCAVPKLDLELREELKRKVNDILQLEKVMRLVREGMLRRRRRRRRKLLEGLSVSGRSRRIPTMCTLILILSRLCSSSK